MDTDDDRKMRLAQEIERGRQAEVAQALCEEWLKQKERDTLDRLANATEAELVIIQQEYKCVLDFKRRVDHVANAGKRAQAKMKEVTKNG
jgi:hypothetical protein